MNLEIGRKLKIAEIGCGSGGRTIAHSKTIKRQILAVDLSPVFLIKLNAKAKDLRWV